MHYASRYIEKKDTEQINLEIKEQVTPATQQKTKSLRQMINFGKLHGDKKNFSKVLKSDSSKKKDRVNVPKRKITLHGSFKEINKLYTDNLTDNNISRIKFQLPDSEPNQALNSKRGTSFLYHYEHNQKENKRKSAVVIVGELTQEEIADMKSVDALILPAIKNVTSSSQIELNQQNCEKSNGGSADITDFFKEKISKKKPHLFKRKRNHDKTQEDSILMYLLEQKANVNAKDFNGSTPLHYAAMRGNAIAAERLLAQKNINIEVN